MIKNLVYIPLSLMMLAGCAKSDDAGDKPTLAVSVEPQRKILEEIVGDRFEVISMISSSTTPETFDPSMRQRSALDKSEAFFITGYLPFESKMSENVSGNVKIVDTSMGIVPVTGTHSHGDNTADIESPDPHVWTSYANAIIMAENMCKAISEIDPENAACYNANTEAIVARLDSLHKDTARKVSAGGVHAFAVWHPSLSYYARDYGLHQIAVGSEGKEMSVGQMREVIDEAKGDSVKVLFFQKEYDLRQAETINRELGSEIVEISPLTYEWENELIHITNELTR